MNTTTQNRLPGVYFQATPPLPEEKLPRMDIAAFVGLAASGPLHTPVPIEDMARFREIFGADLPLAWDATTGQMHYAHLAPTVESFFRNGGRRCWVVRVAGKAQINRFSLPGLVEADTRRPGVARTRCEGSWSDQLRVGTVLLRETLRVDFQSDSDTWRVDVAAATRKTQRGDLFQLTFGDTGLLLFLAVDTVKAVPPVHRVRGTSYWFLRRLATSPPVEVAEFSSTGGLWPVDEATGMALAKAWLEAGSPPTKRQPIAERLTFELVVWSGEQIRARISQLAFSQQHPRFWGHLPMDEALFRMSDRGPVPGEASPLEREASEPRFPLAGPEKPAKLYLPLGMPNAPDVTTTQAPLDAVSPATKLRRDGLKTFSADLFLDLDLAGAGSGTLLTEAHHKYYLRDQPLRGLHSLLPQDEVTLVAVPDAIQRGWLEDKAPSLDVLRAPVLQPVNPPHDHGDYTLSWSTMADATTYTLQEATDPTFAQPVTHYEGEKTTVYVSGQRDCPQRYYYRVRAQRGGDMSPWSNTEVAVIPRSDFEECQFAALEAPELQLHALDSPPADHYRLHWREVEGATRYTVQETADPTFDAATTIYTGDETTLPVRRRSYGVYYYRVRAQRNTALSPWSNTQYVPLEPRPGWVMKEPAAYNNGDLLAVQRALLRLCAARGDLLALLGLPSHYREEEVLTHVAALTPQARPDLGKVTGSGAVRVMPLTVGEERVLSYGALYHPWTMTRVEGNRGETALRLLPPDGAVCGTIAARAITRGAWVAPANEPIAGVVSLAPPISRQGWASLFEAQVNVIQQDPRGFLLLSADTLSPETALQPINVRRLLILLRRLAIREGMTYVFEPNNESFHRLVQGSFEQLLADLYTQGAFVGETPEVAYQVVIDDSINTPVSLEQGRFIVELRVAPSRPMTFITVRLVQMGHEELAIQEI